MERLSAYLADLRLTSRVEGNRQRADVVERHRAIAVKPLVLGRNIAGAVLELPRRIGEDRAEPLAARGGEQVDVRGEGIH